MLEMCKGCPHCSSIDTNDYIIGCGGTDGIEYLTCKKWIDRFVVPRLAPLGVKCEDNR